MGDSPISVVMSVFNGQRYLAEALDSILQQTVSGLELIVINDGSTDDSPRILQQAARRDSRIRLFDQPRLGLTRALNVGIAAARGTLIARMDADDVAEPTRLERQLVFLDAHPSVVAVGTAVTLIDPDGEPLGVRSYPAGHTEIDARLLQGDGVIPHPTALFRRTAWQACGGYRESFPYAQDLDLWLRMGEAGELANLPQPLLRYRLHEEAISAARRSEQLQCARQAVDEARRRRGLTTSAPVLAGLGAVVAPAKIRRGWSRMALRGGSWQTARKHAWAAFRHEPFSPSNWGLAARLMLGAFRRSEPATP